MDDTRREQIEKLVERFEGTAITQDAINEFCNINKIEPPVTKGELSDYKKQVTQDKIVAKLFPEILAELTKLQYIPEFASRKVRKEMAQKNDEVRVNITKLFEENAIKYRFVSNLSEELGNLVGNTVSSAGTTAFNKALAVMIHITNEKFGGDFNMKHARDYSAEVITKAVDKK